MPRAGRPLMKKRRVKKSFAIPNRGNVTSLMVEHVNYMPGSLGSMQRIARLKRYHIIKETTSERNIRLALMEIEALSDKLHLPRNIRETADSIFVKAAKKDLLIGRTVAEFVAASIYAACRQYGVPRSLDEISNASSMSRRAIAKAYRLLVLELGLKMPLDAPLKYLPKISASLKVRRETELLAERILIEAGKMKALVGKDPLAMAAAALYLACLEKKEKCTQKDIADAAGISDLTIRNRLKDLEPVLERMDLSKRRTY